MKKILILIVNILLCFNSFSQDVSQDSIKKEGWVKTGKLSFLVNQTAFSNWISGGENSISGTLAVDYNLNYYKQFLQLLWQNQVL